MRIQFCAALPLQGACTTGVPMSWVVPVVWRQFEFPVLRMMSWPLAGPKYHTWAVVVLQAKICMAVPGWVDWLGSSRHLLVVPETRETTCVMSGMAAELAHFSLLIALQ